MDQELEVLALLTEISVPEGYRIREIEGRLYVFDPQGVPLHGPKDPALLEAYAWRHAWRRIERELNQEVADLHAGVRPLHTLRRVRQYLHMQEAAAGGPHDRDRERRGVRVRAFAAGACVASAAAAAVLLLLPLGPINSPERLTRFGPFRTPAAATLTRHPAAASAAKEPALRSARRLRSGAGGQTVRHAAAHRPVPARYAVSFGQFVDPATAEDMMHAIRRKGYVAYVARFGDDFVVVTAPYRNRSQAERLADALQEIGLPAQLTSGPQI